MKKPPLHKSPLRHLDLFSGIGGFTIAAHWAGFQTVGFAEIEPYCCKILAQWWPNVPNIGDIDKIENFERFKGKITVLTAGVPCQPSSLAGKRRGSGDNRWLWTAVLNCVEAVRPTWLLLENPPGILTLDEFGGILLRLEKAGYEIGIFQVPANAVGAKHLRYRVFIVAHAECSDCDGRWSGWAKEAGCGTRDAVKRSSSDAEALANAESGKHRGITDMLHSAAKLWPTPHANCSTGAGTQGRDGGPNLQTAVKLWPTPVVNDARNERNATANRSDPESKHHSGTTLSDAIRLWPTPTERDWKSTSHGNQGNSRPLSEVAGQTGQGSLNPEFVEALMGFPIGHTRLQLNESPIDHTACEP